ncbi:zf-TFIIB domain-containing protein [Klugiella xanthotipulae]|uniref:Transcription factor zinc-finger domain-containing protein n=1 Tax=Klugiella xanthotipulae TaxID=244735 RepID=A0A543HXR8_9MICO|nr:zf-TFIIB domain-containing protein [Klugiella xanthotipulae]TQM63060.1 hypothetical protein FB466_1309 [Klugiella xanthotipulae]
MECPIDNNTLVMSERNGIEIDYCPQCRGVWLDRGELDKIIERAGVVAPPAPAASGYAEPGYAPQGYPEPSYQPPAYPEQRYNEPRYDDRRHNDHNNGHYGKKKKRENWLSELFD